MKNIYYCNYLIFILLLLIINQLYCNPLIRRSKRAFSYIANDTACIVDNIIYKNGDPIPTDDPCETCRCRPPGFLCVLQHCEIKTGCRAIRHIGECCPSYQCGCEHNGQYYKDGERIHNAESPCYSCYCQGSSITCSLADCQFRFDCEPEYIIGECCPRYDHCPSEFGLSNERISSQFFYTTASATNLTENNTVDERKIMKNESSSEKIKPRSEIETELSTIETTTTTSIPSIPTTSIPTTTISNLNDSIKLIETTTTASITGLNDENVELTTATTTTATESFNNEEILARSNDNVIEERETTVTTTTTATAETVKIVDISSATNVPITTTESSAELITTDNVVEITTVSPETIILNETDNVIETTTTATLFDLTTTTVKP